MCESDDEQLAFLCGEARDEVGALAEDVEQVEHREHHRHVAGGEQRGQMLHGVVEVPREAVLDQQRCELQHLQQQLLRLGKKHDTA